MGAMVQHQVMTRLGDATRDRLTIPGPRFVCRRTHEMQAATAHPKHGRLSARATSLIHGKLVEWPKRTLRRARHHPYRS